ncbi:MAG: NAD(P)H-hydrate dehydratase [Oscillospiraceae bacterium]|nr:NAD(P)H-hydrate dehydratase [Oscillospiraceae bacterium]
MLLSNAARMYDADAAAIHVEGVPSAVLMWNAAGHLARCAMEMMGVKRQCVVFCGCGNNGGDGIGAAAILLRRGIRTRCVLFGRREKMSPDAQEMERRLQSAGGVVEVFDPADATLRQDILASGVLIDALCGIGLGRPIAAEPLLTAVQLMNESCVPVLSADIPSGVEADTGEIRGAAVLAERTVTFSMAKPGHFIEPGCVHTGALEVCDIGVPDTALADAFCGVEALCTGDVRLPVRPRLAHKGSFGRLLILGGCVGYTGAPALAARAAVRSGAGLVYLGVPESIYTICAVKNDEAMPFPLPADEKGMFSTAALKALVERDVACDTLVLGPGMGRGEGVRTLVKELLRRFEGCILLDADALWAISDEPGILKEARGDVVITPHMGEFRRLGGVRGGGRLSDALAFAAEYGCITVLKGHRSIVALPDGRAHIIAAGNPGMARGGSGDVLSGVIGAMLCQFAPDKAVAAGAWVHAAAGDRCAEEKGEYGMSPSDIIAALPEVFKSITK